ncbi:MAG: hypothetical protein IPQ19_09085 [Bacteroidetes bacterium]|nr:hypothetical protein [Bacteroidota bacterium]
MSDNVYTGQAVGKLNHYLKVKETKKLLIFGSSKANHNIDPKILDENSFNMGLDGRSIAYVTTLIKTIENNEDQTILIQIESEDIFSKNYDGDDISPLAIKYHRNAIIKKELDKTNYVNPFHHIFWSIAYNYKTIGIILNYMKPKYDYNTYNGYDPLYIDENQEMIFYKTLSLKNDETCQDSFHINKIYYNYILDLKKIAKEKNKKLFFFTSPLYNDFCKNDNKELSKFANENNIYFIDFTDAFVDNNSISYWKDKTHLSNIGAELFSTKIKEQLIKYY